MHFHHITGYGSTPYIGNAMVFVFSPYIKKLTSCFQFQVNFIFNDFIAQIMLKIICVPNSRLNDHFLSKFLHFVHVVFLLLLLLLLLVIELT